MYVRRKYPTIQGIQHSSIEQLPTCDSTEWYLAYGLYFEFSHNQFNFSKEKATTYHFTFLI